MSDDLLESCRLILGSCTFSCPVRAAQFPPVEDCGGTGQQLTVWSKTYINTGHMRDIFKIQVGFSAIALTSNIISAISCVFVFLTDILCYLLAAFVPSFFLCVFLPLHHSISLCELLPLLRLTLYHWVSLSSPRHSPVSISCHLSPITNPSTSPFFSLPIFFSLWL